MVADSRKPETTADATPVCICRSFTGRSEACDLRPGCPHNPGIPIGDPDLADAAMFHDLRKRNPSAADYSRTLPELPPHWHIAKIEVRRDRAWMYRQGELTYDALLERDGGDYEATGSGPTPAAAVRAAMKEIG